MPNNDTPTDILRRVYPHLAPKRDQAGRGSAWEAAPNIRKHLAAIFPSTRFSTKVQTPQELTVKVSWTHWDDGSTPEMEEVERALLPFLFWSNQPIPGLPPQIAQRQWRDTFAELFGGVHGVELNPQDPTPEQRARKTRAGLQKVVKGGKAASKALNKPKM